MIDPVERMSLQELLDAAFRACRVPPQKVGAEQLVNAQKALQRMLNALPAKISPLWAQDTLVIGIPVDTASVAMPEGTLHVREVYLRRYTELQAVMTINPQSRVFDLGQAQEVAALGFAIPHDATTDIEVAWSDDGLVWTPVWSETQARLKANVLSWVALDPARTHRFWRLSGIDQVDSLDWVVGQKPNDLPLAPVTQRTYDSFSDKSRPGVPNMVYPQRGLTGPVLHLWPVLDLPYRHYCLYVRRQRYIANLGAMTRPLEIPAHWEESLIPALAYRIAMDNPQIDIGILAQLKPLADEFQTLVDGEETDHLPTTIAVGSSYLRR
jgi:hypothetical protein